MEQSQRLSFGPAADLYDRIRPRYPEAAVRWTLAAVPAGAASVVVDLGAGTGILTRQIAALGYDVVPVEPDAGMRAKAGPAALAGTAEEIPMPAGSVDAVLAGQSYHWFDHPRAHAEIARVLKPGGTFAPIWNDRDEDVPWVAALSLVAEDHRDRSGDNRTIGAIKDDIMARKLGTATEFGPVELETFHQSVTHTPETLVALMRSRSWYLVAGPDEKARMDAAIRDLCATHPDLAGRAEFELPYVTRAYRTHKIDTASP
jgi:SAM-dependent methyltransferase